MRISLMATAVFAIAALATPTLSMAQNIGILGSGPSAALEGAMTERQARAACKLQMSGSKESRRSIAVKMKTCMNGKMNGN